MTQGDFLQSLSIVSPTWTEMFFQAFLKAYKTNCRTFALEGVNTDRRRVKRKTSVCCEEPLVFTLNSVISACWAETPAAVWCSEAAESPRAACDGDNDFPHWDYYTAVSSLCTRPIKYAWMFEMNFGGSAPPPPPPAPAASFPVPLLTIVKLYNHIPVY